MPLHFVGCPSDGQVGPLPAPVKHAVPKTQPIAVASRVAYYATEGLAVMAPAGWHCFQAYGSNGSTLLITPEPLTFEVWTNSAAPKKGFAVQLSLSLGETSGRFEVAEIAAMLFPKQKAFVDRVGAEGTDSPSEIRGELTSADRVLRRNDFVVEYETAAGMTGLGERSFLGPGPLPITGVAIILPKSGMNLMKLDLRLPPQDADLVDAIVAQTERDIGVTRPSP